MTRTANGIRFVFAYLVEDGVDSVSRGQRISLPSGPVAGSILGWKRRHPNVSMKWSGAKIFCAFAVGLLLVLGLVFVIRNRGTDDNRTVAVHGLVDVAAAKSGSPAAVDWPMFRGGPALLGVASVQLPEQPALLWSFKTQGPVKSSAAIAGERVFIGSDDGQLYA